jgi:hypothetical protein
MADIVERLKQREPWWGKLHDYVIAKRGEAIGTEWFGRFNAIAHSIRGRLPVEDEAADTITTLRARVAQLEADKAKLREAMEPFDSIVLGCPGHWRDDHSVYVALGHLRRARLALAETGEKP